MSGIRQPSFRSALLWLTIVVMVLLTGAAIWAWKVKKITLAREINPSDVFANILTLVGLYVTVFVVYQITARDKRVDIEKALVMDRLKDLHNRIESFNDKVDTQKLNFKETIRDLDRLARIHVSIVKLLDSPDPVINVSQEYIDGHKYAFAENIDKCREVLTYTPPRAISAVQLIQYIMQVA